MKVLHEAPFFTRADLRGGKAIGKYLPCQICFGSWTFKEYADLKILGYQSDKLYYDRGRCLKC